MERDEVDKRAQAFVETLRSDVGLEAIVSAVEDACKRLSEDFPIYSVDDIMKFRGLPVRLAHPPRTVRPADIPPEYRIVWTDIMLALRNSPEGQTEMLGTREKDGSFSYGPVLFKLDDLGFRYILVDDFTRALISIPPLLPNHGTWKTSHAK